MQPVPDPGTALPVKIAAIVNTAPKTAAVAACAGNPIAFSSGQTNKKREKATCYMYFFSFFLLHRYLKK